MMFENLTVNMTSSNQLEPAEVTDGEPWAQQLDLQWEKRFELREPPTEDARTTYRRQGDAGQLG